MIEKEGKQVKKIINSIMICFLIVLFIKSIMHDSGKESYLGDIFLYAIILIWSFISIILEILSYWKIRKQTEEKQTNKFTFSLVIHSLIIIWCLSHIYTNYLLDEMGYLYK